MTENNQHSNDSTWFSKRLNKYLSESKLHMYRNLSYGAAGVCLVVILSIVQVWDNSSALNICLYSATFGIPVWLSFGSIFEFYILTGKESHAHYRSAYAQTVFGSLFFAGGLSIIISISSIIYYLNSNVLWVFGVSIVFMIIFLSKFQARLAKTLSNDNDANT